ncbi:MAG: hypothetical protein HY671_10950 [Chloroflexi bacterium]|nr:hypothetical protein [Chloroflexota bacterium]
MSRPWFSILGVIIIVMVSLAVSPAPASAAKPVAFNATGTIGSISPGTVKPAGGSGRFVVVEREIGGFFVAGDLGAASISGDPTSGVPFTMYYKANVELATQAGNLHGTLTAGDKVLNLNGKIDPLGFVDIGIGVPLPKLSISGHWNFTNGAQGEGEFTAWAIFAATPEGHIFWIPLSGFAMTGQWQP